MLTISPLMKMVINWIRRKMWKPKGKIYSLKCNQCNEGFLSSYSMDAPICGHCLQRVKSNDTTINTEKHCRVCGKIGTIHSSDKCDSCYFK